MTATDEKPTTKRARPLAQYREERVMAVRECALAGRVEGEDIFRSGRLVSGPMVRVGLWRDLVRLRFKDRDKNQLLGVKW